MEIDGDDALFIETKNPANALDIDKIERDIVEASGSWDNAEINEPGLEIGDDGRIITFGTRRRGVETNGRLSSEDDIRSAVEQVLQDSFVDGSNVDFDAVRILRDEDIVEVKVDEAFRGDD